MPYNTTNHPKFVLAQFARWYSMEKLVVFWETMFALKFRFEAERVAGADKIAEFVNSGRRGNEMFSYTLQFPDTVRDYYISTDKEGLRTVLEDLHNVLTSVRSDTTGKDVASTKTEDSTTKQIREQKAQDENKAFQSALKRLGELAFKPENYMSREGFQTEYNLTWT